MLECVINVSEGRDRATIAAVAGAAGGALLDVHSDAHHHRSVITIAGAGCLDAARGVAAEAMRRIDLRTHAGVHPRIGAVDVVPFVPLGDTPMEAARRARDEFAMWFAGQGVPCYLYGEERTLPEVRKAAGAGAPADVGPPAPHPTAGACAVGARPLLVAYNVWLRDSSVDTARRIAASLRSPSVRALGLDVGGHAQVSCNLIDPSTTGPDAVVDAVAASAEVARAELVGLCPAAVLEGIPERRWAELDLDPSRTIEARLEEAGLV